MGRQVAAAPNGLGKAQRARRFKEECHGKNSKLGKTKLSAR
jgi:hypothetical protein